MTHRLTFKCPWSGIRTKSKKATDINGSQELEGTVELFSLRR